MLVYLKCAIRKFEMHFMLYAMHIWHLQFDVTFLRLMRFTHQLKEILILWKQVMVHWMRPFGILHLSDEKAHHESAICTFVGFSVSSRTCGAPYALSRKRTFRMPNLRDALCGAYLWNMHSQTQFRVLYWISKNFTNVWNCTSKFTEWNVTFIMGIIKFSCLFQRTLPSLKLAVSDLRTELSNSRAWMSKGLCHFQKNKTFVDSKAELLGVTVASWNAEFAFVGDVQKFFPTCRMLQPNFIFAISEWGKELRKAFGRPWFRYEFEEFICGYSNLELEFGERIPAFYSILMFFM